MKKWTKILCSAVGGVLGLGFLLTGCATVGDIKNPSNEVVFNGNSAVMIDGHLYYGNSFADISTFSNDDSYKSSAKLSYLARLNTNASSFATDGKDFSPENVEKVAEKVAGHENSFMFALGNYIYYATPNREEISNGDGTSSYQYSYTTLFRSKLNGDDVKEIYTTNGEISQIEVLKYGGKYYVVIYAGTTLVKIEVGDKVGDVKTIAEDVTGVAMPETYQQDKAGSTLDFNGYIYYTTARTVEDYANASGTQFNRVLLTSDSGEKMSATTSSISLIGREKDVVFFTKDGATYSVNVANNASKNIFTDNGNATRLYNGSVTDLDLIASDNVDYGYIFKSSETLMYKEVNASATSVKFVDGEGAEITDYNFLAADGTVRYISTTTGIYKADFATISNGSITCDTIVKMTGIHDGSLYAYDGKYIYFYAQLQDLEDKAEEDASITETDANYYLYRAKADVNPKATSKATYELLSLTETDERHS